MTLGIDENICVEPYIVTDRGGATGGSGVAN